MNRSITSREKLIRAAMEIAEESGLSKVSVRALAARCGIGVGTLYNYFPTKSDLLLAIVEGHYQAAFGGLSWSECSRLPFAECFALIYGAVAASAQAGNTNWLAQLDQLPPREREYVERDSILFLKVKQIMANSLAGDAGARPDLWDADFTRGAFVDFCLKNIFRMAAAGADCAFFVSLIRRAIY